MVDTGVGVLGPADSWSSTEVRSVVHNHMWTIRGFSHCECRYLETSAKIRDTTANQSVATTSSSDSSVLTFRIRLHPQGNKESNKDFTFFQCFCHNPSQHLRSKYKFTVFNSRGEEIATTVYTGTQQLHGYFEYIRRDLLVSHILPQDELQINLELTITFDTITRTSQSSKLSVMPAPKIEEVCKDLEDIYVDTKLWDFTICIGDRKILAHKVILSARSPVFAAMLEPHTEEARSNTCIIKDIDYDVMNELMLFLYSGRAPSIGSMSLELLSAADRFQVHGLKMMADHVLRNNLTPESCCRHLAYADLYSSHDLRAEAIRYITQNAPQVVKTEGWTFLSQNHPDLVTELFVKMAEKNVHVVSASSSISFGAGEPAVKRVRASEPPSSE
ncbi:unnamed protein product [Auanema sp. JU1783]|nr:unnamed protein product [Auanema sp. JU1783]